MAFLLMARVFRHPYIFHQWIRLRNFPRFMAHMPRNCGNLWIADNWALVIIRLDALMIDLTAKIACCKQELQSGRCGPSYGFQRGFDLQEAVLRLNLELDRYRHLKYHLLHKQMELQLVSQALALSLSSPTMRLLTHTCIHPSDEFRALSEHSLSEDSESENEGDDYSEMEDGEMVVVEGDEEDNNEEESDEEMDDAEMDEIDDDMSGNYEPTDEGESDEEY